MKNTIFLRRKNKVIVPKGVNHLPDIYLATALKNLESLGYTFSKPLMEQVRTLSAEKFTTFYKQLITDIKEMLGANVSYQPMYPNFPDQVMKLEESALYINAIIHYHTLLLPSSKIKERLPLLDRVDLKVIDLGSEQEFNKMIQHLISANTSISETDKKDIEWAITNTDNVEALLPTTIPVKENLAFVVATLLKYQKAPIEKLSTFFQTATDILRLATALSDGDVSLASNTKYRKFTHYERRMILGLLEQCSNLTEDMMRYKKRWIRLGEILHPFEYKKRFPKCYEAFDVIRNKKAFQTFNGKVEVSLLQKKIPQVISLLKNRPGEFARRLDHLLRLTRDPQLVLNQFSAVAHQVSTPLLLQVLTHFQHRNKPHDIRTIFPKGNVAKVIAIPNELPLIDQQICLSAVDICQKTLIERFAKLPSLGKVFIDKRLQSYLVPFSERSASKSFRTIVRGSKLDIPEGNTIRFFTWWKEGLVNGKHTGSVDIDLSMNIYDEKWSYKEHISFTNLKSSAYKAYHSGDITSAPNGACEFIDLDIPSVLHNGGRYVVMSLHSFTHQPFSSLPECYTGWMIRQYPNSGEIFEPATVQNKIDVTANTKICIPLILDLQERKVIWTDLALKRHPDYYNTIEGNQRGIVMIGKALTSLTKPTLYDLFSLHALSRGILVDQRSEADTIFSVEEGTTPFDIEKIMSDFLI